MDGGSARLDDFAEGYVLGILVGEGHFGGDGRQAQVTVRMHVRHEAIFRRLTALFPRSALYGPYHHGGRSYFQWMARGECLRDEVAPLVRRRRDWLDPYVLDRFDAMCSRYGLPGADPAPPTPAT